MSLSQKLTISFNSALLFVILSLPITYKLVGDLVGNLVQKQNAILLHSLVFLLISYVSMSFGETKTESIVKFSRALIGATLFLLLSTPFMYSITSNITTGYYSILLHAFIYMSLLTLFMYA